MIHRIILAGNFRGGKTSVVEQCLSFVGNIFMVAARTAGKGSLRCFNIATIPVLSETGYNLKGI